MIMLLRRMVLFLPLPTYLLCALQFLPFLPLGYCSLFCFLFFYCISLLFLTSGGCRRSSLFWCEECGCGMECSMINSKVCIAGWNDVSIICDGCK